MLALMFSQDNTFNIQPDEHGAFFIGTDFFFSAAPPHHHHHTHTHTTTTT